MSDIRIRIIEPLPQPQKRPSRLNALVLWAIAAGGLIAASLLTPFLAPAMQGMNAHVQLLVTNLLYYLPFVVLPVFLLARRTPELFEAYRPNPISFFNTACIVVLALLGMFFVNDITILWSIPFEKLGLNPFPAELPAASNTFELMISVISIAVIPAVCEEFLFRGAVMSALEGEGTRRAMWITSILFMAIHGSLMGMPTQIILGMVLAALVFWCDSIYAGLIYHTVHNASAVILQYVQAATVPAEESAMEGDMLSAIGGLTGVVELCFNILLSAGLILFTMKLFRARGQLRGVTPEPRKKAPLRKAEWAAIILGGLMCAVLYAVDFIAMLGG